MPNFPIYDINSDLNNHNSEDNLLSRMSSPGKSSPNNQSRKSKARKISSKILSLLPQELPEMEFEMFAKGKLGKSTHTFMLYPSCLCILKVSLN